MPRGNNNPLGRNQHPRCPPVTCKKTEGIIRDYHRRGYTNRVLVSQLLLQVNEIYMGEATVARRFSAFGLHCSGMTAKIMKPEAIRQVILEELAMDPSGNRGPRIIKEGIARRTAIHLPRDLIRQEMLLQNPEGFANREPTRRKIHRTPLLSLGPNHEWSADGHDKLTQIGFPIYGIRDKYSGKWLLLRVLPNNRLKDAIAYCYLSLLEELGGMPVQMTTDKGSETTEVFAFGNALREFFSDISSEEIPAHVFLQSIRNITVERGWLRLRLQWGENVKQFWEAGAHIYHPHIAVEKDLVDWLWPRLIQQELDGLKDTFNDHKVRWDEGKKLPSGTTPQVAYSLPELYGGEDHLIPVDITVVQALKSHVGDGSVAFVSSEYAQYAQAVYESIGSPLVTFQNVWGIFSSMLSAM